MNGKGTIGEWTALFGRVLPFREEAARAEEIKAEFRLSSTPGDAPEFSRVSIVLKDLPGWREPLWASDEHWLYLRRPEGVWKTRLPKDHLERVGILFQTRGTGERLYGGTTIGQNFDRREGWRLFSQSCEPWELDFPEGLDESGNKLCSMLSDAVEGGPARLIMAAGPAFSAAPVSWRWERAHLLANLADGTTVNFPIAPGLDLEPTARAGELWLRNSTWKHDWVDPSDYRVSL